MNAIDCTEFRRRSPELALGLLGGGERGAAIDHMAVCAACRADLEGLMRVSDLLVHLPPAVEPDLGFESLVMRRLAAEGAFAASGASMRDTGGRQRRWLRPIMAAAAAVVVLVAGIAGLVARRDTGRARPAAVAGVAPRAVVIRADGGRSWCQLVAFPATGGQPARVVVQLDEPDGSLDSYGVLVEPTNRRPPVPVGIIGLVAGHGTMTASIPPGTGSVDAVRIIDSAGSVKYRAVFAPV
ncbi:MAG TPA: hypothetical protein VHT75_19210 [Acidimicrobiales bacterium]|nr:hypothetical protein [Acidimicrobiales bacterium]